MCFILFNLENQVMSDGEQMPEDVEHIPPPPSRSATLIWVSLYFRFNPYSTTLFHPQL